MAVAVCSGHVQGYITELCLKLECMYTGHAGTEMKQMPSIPLTSLAATIAHVADESVWSSHGCWINAWATGIGGHVSL